MKKIFIIFLAFVLALGIFTVSIAESDDFCIKVNSKLTEIEGNIVSGNTIAANDNLAELRVFIYEWVRELASNGEYNEQILYIINLAVKAIEENNVKYILEAKQILDVVNKTNFKIEESNHS